MVTSPCLWSVCRCFVTWGWRSPSRSAISPTARGEAPSNSTIRSRFGSTSAASAPWSTAKVWLGIYIHCKEYITPEWRQTMHRLERTYAASPETIWDLWTTPEGIEQWWAPDGFETKVSQI